MQCYGFSNLINTINDMKKGMLQLTVIYIYHKTINFLYVKIYGLFIELNFF